MSRYIKCLYVLVGMTFILQVSFAQTKEELEKKKAELSNEIKYNNKLLKETKKNKQLSLSQLLILNKKIANRQQLISAIHSEIRLLNNQIEENHSLIEAMENDIQKLKEEYAKMIYFAYKNRNNYNRLMFLFSSEDFNQAYKRLKYYQQYTRYRQTQAALIKKTQLLLNNKVVDLETKKAEKQHLLGYEHTEKKALSSEKQEQQNVFRGLQKKEKQLQSEINKKRQEASRLKKAIERIIEEEMKAKGKNYFALTPEARALSNSFAGNKGKLPWPVLKGTITGYFGEHSHPVLKKVKIKNNGIDISTTVGAIARSVFEGEVTSVIIIQGAGKAVMIRHGEYITIYAQLKEAFVKSGDKVKTKQEIGSVITDESSGKTELHFELWKRREILNPSQWIYRTK